MSLDVKSQNATCDGPKPTKCSIGAGETFTLSVEVNAGPDGGYVGFQTQIAFGSLVYKPRPAVGDEIAWPDSASPVFSAPSADIVNHGDLSGFISPLPSIHIGNIVEVDVNCAQGGAFEIALPLYAVGTNPFGSTFYIDNGAARALPPSIGQRNIDVDGDLNTELVDVADTLVIDCGAPPVETVGTTIGAGGGSLSTGAGDPVEVVLDVPAGALPGNTDITINVFAPEDVSLPTNDATFFTRVFQFEPDGLTFSTPGTAVISYDESEVAGIDEATLDVMVYDSGEWGLAVVLARDTVSNTLTIEMDHFSHRLPTARDADQDGCPNEYELRFDERDGGLRDMTIRWDYYDVLGPGAVLPADRFIDLANDILGVIFHYSPDGTDNHSIFGYDVNFDRGPSAGPNPWNMTAPDGVIDLANDILGVVLQNQHDCQDPP
jgi:hypothetical protein